MLKGGAPTPMTSRVVQLTANMGGCKPFEDAQAASCECVAEKKAERHRARVIGGFYKRHNKEKNSDKKNKELAKKHASTSKFAKLMLKLVKKYPKSIKKVKDPQAKMYVHGSRSCHN